MSLDQILSQIERGRVQFHFYAVIDIVGDALGMAIVKKLLALGIKPDERFNFVHGIVSKRDEPKAGGTPLTSMSYYVGEKSKWTGMPTYKVDGTGYGLAIYAPEAWFKGKPLINIYPLENCNIDQLESIYNYLLSYSRKQKLHKVKAE